MSGSFYMFIEGLNPDFVSERAIARRYDRVARAGFVVLIGGTAAATLWSSAALLVGLALTSLVLVVLQVRKMSALRQHRVAVQKRKARDARDSGHLYINGVPNWAYYRKRPPR